MKVKKILLSLVLMMSMLFAVSCGEKKEDPSDDGSPTLTAPTVSVSVAERVYLVGERLSDIELAIGAGSTSGSAQWVESSYVLSEGENACGWVFKPTDSDTYSQKTGSITIVAYDLKTPEVIVSLKSGQTVYIDAKYSTIELEATATFGAIEVLGTIEWVSPNETFVQGENTCEWIFKPTDNTNYKEVTGTIIVNANTDQEPVAIAVSSNSKTNYKAFDILDLNTITVNLIYNKGKVEEMSDPMDLTVSYPNGDSFRVGDTKAIVKYMDFEADVEGLTIDHKIVKNPVFTEILTYNGSERELSLPQDSESKYYTYESIKATDAGEYPITVTLKDSDNYKWENGESVSAVVICTIHKANIEVIETNYSGEYDGFAHSSSVQNTLSKPVYYSETELNDENFTEGLEKIEKTNAGEYVIYYYIEGETNYNEKVGSLTIDISKQTPVMNLESCYTLLTNNTVNYPTKYVSIVDKNKASIEYDNLKITYFSSYNVNDLSGQSNIKTTAENGASSVGGAPKNINRNGAYFVLVEFAGNENFNEVNGLATLYIDTPDVEFRNLIFRDEVYAVSQTFTSGGQTFDVYETGSNAECNAYLEFIEQPVDSDGLKLVAFKSKFGVGDSAKKNGRLIYKNSRYCLACEDGTEFVFSFDSSKDELTIAQGVIPEIKLVNWELPKYLKTFSAETISVEDLSDKNKGQNTEITFYNDYGTIRFSAKVNVQYSENAAGNTGGYEEWSGVAVFKIMTLEGMQVKYYGLDCTVMSEDSLTCTGYPSDYQMTSGSGFRVVWNVSTDGNIEPSNVKIADKNNFLSSAPYSALLTPDFNAVNEE